MKDQFEIYSVDTKAFYTEEERIINNNKFLIKKEMQLIEDWIIHIHYYQKDSIEFQEYIEKLELFGDIKKKKDKTPQEEVLLKDLKELFSKPKKKRKRKLKKEYITSQEKAFENNNLKVKSSKDIKTRAKELLKENETYRELKLELSKINSMFNEELLKSEKRFLNPKALTPYNKVSLFENDASRIMEIPSGEVGLKMIIVRAYHYEVLGQLIKNGFDYIDEYGEIRSYKVFTSSAGQIRTKKVVFIEEESWKKYEKTLMCGLTIADINNSSEKGCNVNKFLAYLALCNSATDKLEGFDIDKAIVIEDFETVINGEVDYIDNKTFEVTRKFMDIPIPHSDGCGWVLPRVSKKNFMIRLPWVKGLMTPVDYVKFCSEYNKGDYKIKDIYGKEWDLQKDDIEYVFTKSQFKMWKYYPNILNESGDIIEYGWNTYTRNFKELGCNANLCNLEPDTKEFRRASFNYQMWQTLTDITDDEISEFTDKVDEFITKGYSDRKTMLNLLGADDQNKKKNDFQKCIEIYPELIRDYHAREELASMLNARKKEAKYGKIKIDGTYTFIIPDVFAWLEYTFLGHKEPMGILKNGEVSCRLYKDKKELIVNRSPHLYREHVVRNNIIDNNTKKWFITNGVYTSSHDLISKILQFDVDGDKGLVITNENLIEIAKRNMKGIVPLYYEMGKAKPQIINETNIYESLVKAFSFSNIGKFSNKLTVMWNLENPNLKTIAQIAALNNFTIDAAKTLLVPDVPKDVSDEMKEANGKLPYFFQFAKDKDSEDVAEINSSTVNRICRNIENIKQSTYDFSSLGKFNKNYLMNNNKIEIHNELIDFYNTLEQERNNLVALTKAMFSKDDSFVDINKEIKKLFVDKCKELELSVVDSIDMVIRYIYSTNRNSKKGFLFDLFGDVIYENLSKNIKKSLGEYIMCEICGERVKLETPNSKRKYCEKCGKMIDNAQRSERRRLQVSEM